MFTESFKGISRKFQGCFNAVSCVFQRNFREMSRMLQESSKGTSSKFENVFQVGLRGFQGYWKEV